MATYVIPLPEHLFVDYSIPILDCVWTDRSRSATCNFEAVTSRAYEIVKLWNAIPIQIKPICTVSRKNPKFSEQLSFLLSIRLG